MIHGPDRSIRLDAGTLHYRDVGSGPTVVFIHGIFVNGLLWRQTVAALESGYRCVVPDLPLGAHGQALRTDADLTPGGVADLLLDFLAALDLRDVTLVANDTGGAICQLAIAKDHARIARLVLTNCDSYEHFFVPAAMPFVYAAHVPGFAWLLAQATRPVLVRRAFVRTLAKRVPGDDVLAAWFDPALHDAGVRRDLRRFLKTVSNRYTFEAARSFARFTKAVLIVWGQDDIFFPRRDGERLAQSFPNASLERVADSRAFVPEDQPAKLAALIAEFVGTPEAKDITEACA